MSGSPAWTNSFTRITKHYPGRLVFLAVNLVVALVLMEAEHLLRPAGEAPTGQGSGAG